ncbi:MAG: TetR family transcriptional regulator C-terminal domain-containing protein [Oscillospiraceae bacterium]|nr:TetR family transcriptional regulator C-terminal domain-containing protein [Oscillospiraceae bacterium]
MNTDKIYAEALANEYAPKDTSKVVALKKLDRRAKLPANVFAYTFGILGTLVVGVGMCLSMQVIGAPGAGTMTAGIIVGLVGLLAVSVNYPVYKRLLKNPQVMQTEKTYAALLGDILDQILARHQVPEEDRGYMLSFYIEGTMGIVKRWLLSDCRESLDDIARIMMNVIRR